MFRELRQLQGGEEHEAMLETQAEDGPRRTTGSPEGP